MWERTRGPFPRNYPISGNFFVLLRYQIRLHHIFYYNHSMKILLIPAHSRYTAKHSWLESKHLFSFADYYDPANLHFWALRVFNDDVIAGHNGFGMHAHDNMEIITIVLSGSISHEDSHGWNATVEANGAQVMSAGSWLRHSEKNNSEEPVHLYQIWIMPREENMTPWHDERDFSTLSHGSLVPIASWFEHEALTIHADAVVYRGIFDKQSPYTHTVQQGTGNVFIYVTQWSVKLISGETLEAGDQARISDVEILEMSFSGGTDVIVIDVAA